MLAGRINWYTRIGLRCLLHTLAESHHGGANPFIFLLLINQHFLIKRLLICRGFRKKLVQPHPPCPARQGSAGANGSQWSPYSLWAGYQR